MSAAVVSSLHSDGYFDSRNDILSSSGCTSSDSLFHDDFDRRSFSTLEFVKKNLLDSQIKSSRPMSEKFTLGLGMLSRYTASLSSASSTNEHRKLDRSLSEPVDRQQQKSNQTNSSRYKTELCRPYEENGTCKYGDKCQFAHGHHELRNLARHPKYKTELCRTFHSSGFCPYGPRCHFIHNPDESRKSANSSCTSSCSNSQSSSPPPQHQTLRQSIRPKALSVSNYASLSSTGETSPSSSLSGSPTSFGSFFEDAAVFSPKTPLAQNAFSFSNDFSGVSFLADINNRKYDADTGIISKKPSSEIKGYRRHNFASTPAVIKQALLAAELKRLDLNETRNCRSQVDFGRDEGVSSYSVLTPHIRGDEYE